MKKSEYFEAAFSTIVAAFISLNLAACSKTLNPKDAAYYDKLSGAAIPEFTTTFEEYKEQVYFDSSRENVTGDEKKNTIFVFSYALFPVEGLTAQEMKSWADVACTSYLAGIVCPAEKRAFEAGEAEAMLLAQDEKIEEYKSIKLADGRDAMISIFDLDDGYPSESDAVVIQKLKDETEALFKTITILPPVDTSAKKLTFETVDSDGNKVSSKDLFAKADVTFMNIWATWCGPCVSELTDLQDLSKDLEGTRAQVILMLQDATDIDDEEVETAKNILEKKGVTMNFLIWDESIEDQINLLAFPTSYILDSKGNGIGEAIIGVHSKEQYKEAIMKALEK